MKTEKFGQRELLSLKWTEIEIMKTNKQILSFWMQCGITTKWNWDLYKIKVPKRGIRKIGKLLCSKDGEVWSAEIIVIKNGRKFKWWNQQTNCILLNVVRNKDKVKSKFVKDQSTKLMKVVGVCSEQDDSAYLKKCEHKVIKQHVT